MLYKNTTNYLCSERHPRGLRLDHVLTPLKSELDFHKLLITNDLTKCDSLQTFVFWRTGKQHLCRENAGEDGLVDESDFSGKFSTHTASLPFRSRWQSTTYKNRDGFGCLGKYPKAGNLFITC